MNLRRRGFALVSALFLLVVLSLLGAFLVGIVAVQHATPAMRVNASRAEYAARSAAAWAATRAFGDNACPVANFALDGGALAGFRVQVTCTASGHVIGATDTPDVRNYYVIEARSESGVFGSPDYVSRTVKAKVLGPATVTP